MSVKEKTGRFVTLKDIAESLGLSINAVSKALRDRPDISEETKKKVRQKADELGYIPDNQATSLRRGRTNLIAVVFNDFYNPYFSIFCDKVFREIEVLGFQSSLIFCNTTLMDMKDVENILVNKFCGVISFVEPTDSVSEFFRQRGIPFTLIGINSNSPAVDCIYTDDFEGGRLVGEHFVNGPCRHALYLTNSFSETSYRRFSGFSAAVTPSGKPFIIIPYQLQDDVIRKAYGKIAEENCDFIFCFSDSLAIALCSYLQDKNYKRPITIMGYDNLHKYYPIIQKLNSVDSNMDEIIKYASEHIVAKITGHIEMQKKIEKMFPVSLSLI